MHDPLSILIQHIFEDQSKIVLDFQYIFRRILVAVVLLLLLLLLLLKKMVKLVKCSMPSNETTDDIVTIFLPSASVKYEVACEVCPDIGIVVVVVSFVTVKVRFVDIVQQQW